MIRPIAFRPTPVMGGGGGSGASTPTNSIRINSSTPMSGIIYGNNNSIRPGVVVESGFAPGHPLVKDGGVGGVGGPGSRRHYGSKCVTQSRVIWVKPRKKRAGTLLVAPLPLYGR